MWLIGMMGSGKSSAGPRAAEELGVAFYDTDDMVVDLAGRSITEIWEDSGEAEFRALERVAVASVPEGCLAAAGGGAVLDEVNREVMAASTPVIWLRGAPSHLAARLGAGSDRPLLEPSHATEDRLAAILRDRISVYEATATHIVDTDDLTVEEVAREVVAICRS